MNASRKDSKTKAISHPESSQNRAMDASINALEKNLLNYSLWNYMSDNNEQWGDCWNGEDLSIWQSLPTKSSYLDTFVGSSVSTSTSSTVAADESDDKLSKKKAALTADRYLDSYTNPSIESFESGTRQQLMNRYKGEDGDEMNARNLVSLHRPHPRFTAGTPLGIDFVSPTASTRASFEYILMHNVHCDGPTELYIPACYFPLPSSPTAEETKVKTSAGRWEFNSINKAYWILLWWIDEEDVQEASIKLEGVSFSSR
ncbi:unnamed protein product [Mucor hiemalis]